MSAWYRDSFGLDYLRLYPHRDLPEARANIAALLCWLPLPRHEPLLDLACGAGRVLLALREHGFSRLAGLDLSDELLAVAAASLRDEGAPVRPTVSTDAAEVPVPAEGEVVLLHGDMRDVPAAYTGQFATVFSIFTSFGYFESDAQNRRVLEAIAGALRPGGTVVMDYLNRDAIIAHLVPDDERRLANGDRVLNHRCVTADGLRVEKTATLVRGDGSSRVFQESVRMYTAAEMVAMFEAARLHGVRLHGSFSGESFSPASERLILVATRGTGAC